MKIIITEEQNKKLFVPRKIDEREKQFLNLIKFTPLIDFMVDNKTYINFDASTPTDDFDWGVYDISAYVNNTYVNLYNEHYSAVKELILNIVDDIEGVFRIWGEFSVENNKLYVKYEYEVSKLNSGVKTYQL